MGCCSRFLLNHLYDSYFRVLFPEFKKSNRFNSSSSSVKFFAYSTTYIDNLDQEIRNITDPILGFSFRAIKVIPKKLPEALFDYAVLLDEGE